MNCLKCKTETSDGMTFEVMKVLSRKVKNPMGRIGKQLATEQELCGFEQYRICDSCIDSKLDAIAHPWKEFTDKFKVALIFLIVGTGLVIANLGKNDNATVAGVLCIVFFGVKFFKFLKSSKKKKESFAKFSETNARFVAAWECLSEVAPRRNQNSETIFFIPVTKATYEMKKEDFSTYYRLTPGNAAEFHKLLQKKKKADS